MVSYSFNIAWMNETVLSEGIWCDSNVTFQKLPQDLLAALSIKPGQEIIIPTHLHLRRLILPHYLGKDSDFIIEAPLPSSFQWTCKSLDLHPVHDAENISYASVVTDNCWPVIPYIVFVRLLIFFWKIQWTAVHSVFLMRKNMSSLQNPTHDDPSSCSSCQTCFQAMFSNPLYLRRSGEIASNFSTHKYISPSTASLHLIINFTSA